MNKLPMSTSTKITGKIVQTQYGMNVPQEDKKEEKPTKK